MNSFATRLVPAMLCLATLLYMAAPLQAQDTAGGAPAHQGLGALKPWTGDFDGMAQRRVIRFLVPYSKTIYFLDKGRQYGTAVERGRAFQAAVNKGRKKADQQITVVYVPMPRDQLFPALAKGLGDIVAASLTVTQGRSKEVDFGTPFISAVKEGWSPAPRRPPCRASRTFPAAPSMSRRLRAITNIWRH